MGLQMKIAIKTCLLVLAFVPLIVDMSVFFPFISGKNLLVETCLVLVGILILINFFYSRSFKEEIIGKVSNYIKNPLVISTLAFFSILAISTIFAVDKSAAFWGDLSRAEGLANMIFFFAFFFFTLLTFEKKDWLWFFKYSLIVSLILLVKQFSEHFSGLVRPGSFTGNPTFLAGYLLFSITSASVIYFEEKSWLWKFLAGLTVLLSIIGIFLAETRGTILGLALGIIAALIYCAFKGKEINYKKINLRQVSLGFIILGVIFSGVFVMTRSNPVWQKVPGLSRVAVINSGNSEDISTPVRLYLYKSSLESVNPIKNGYKKLLLGWGPENFILAESQNYDPGLYNIEPDWHDRAHNKFLDVLVMTGLIGLLAYLAIWFFFFKPVFKRHNFSVINLTLLFFGVSYITHLLFVFDTISTSVPFFGILAFTAYLWANNTPEEPKRPEIRPEVTEKREILAGTFLAILTLFLGYIFFANTAPGYMQMRSFASLVNNSNSSTIGNKIDAVLTPFTVAQMNIRASLLSVTNDFYNKSPDVTSDILLKKAITSAEDYVKVRPLDFKFQTTLADLYNKKGNSLGDSNYLKRGEELFRNVLNFAPYRPDMNRKLARNLISQGEYAEAFEVYEKTFSSNPLVIDQDKVEFEGIYTRLVQYFYEQKDKANFIKVADRLKANSFANSALLNTITEYLEKNNVWPVIKFQ